MHFESWSNFRNELFFNKLHRQFSSRCSDQRHLYGQPVAQQTEPRQFTLTCTHLKCLLIITCLIFNPSWIFIPCNMFMCTNKTCFAGVGTWPKQLILICLSYPCKSKKKSEFSVSRSHFDSRCKPFVSCSWMECDFCFAIENSRLFKTVICGTNSLCHCLSRDAEHIRLTAFQWRCDKVEMRGTCLGPEKSMQTKVVINFWKLYYNDSWSLSHLGYLYPGTTPVMIKLYHNRSCPWVWMAQVTKVPTIITKVPRLVPGSARVITHRGVFKLRAGVQR